MKKQDYNTKARRYILEFLSSKADTTVSAKDILDYLNDKGENISLTTVYRYLNKLSEEKDVIKFSEGNSSKSVYQYAPRENACHNHLHIQCVKCGRLIHLDCDFIEELSNHIKEKHNFSLEYSGSILYGVCDNCK